MEIKRKPAFSISNIENLSPSLWNVCTSMVPRPGQRSIRNIFPGCGQPAGPPCHPPRFLVRHLAPEVGLSQDVLGARVEVYDPPGGGPFAERAFVWNFLQVRDWVWAQCLRVSESPWHYQGHSGQAWTFTMSIHWRILFAQSWGVTTHPTNRSH